MEKTTQKSKDKMSLSMLLLQGRTIIVLVTLLIVFGIFTPNFLKTTTMILMAKHSSLIILMAIGMTLVIINGGIDLSIGSVVGLSGMIAGGLIKEGLSIGSYTIYFHVVIVVIIALIIGVLVGAVNGWLISKMNVPPFIATLGTLYIARGLAMLRSNGETFSQLQGKAELGNTGFDLIGSTTIINIPISIWMMLLMILVAVFITKKTPLGWHIFAVGGNERAAKLSGVNIFKTKMFVYMFSGFCSAIVGVIVASQLVSSHPANGETWEMNAIAAAVLGGTSMSGGIGTIVGTLIGGLIIGVLNDGMVMSGISQFWQMVIKGGVIILAVVMDQLQREFQKRYALQKQAK